MHRSLVGGIVQRLAVAFVAGHEVAFLKARIPPGGGSVRGENAALVLAASYGVGVLDAQAAARLRDAMRGAPSPSQAGWRARMEGGRIVGVDSDGLEVVQAERRTRAVVGRGRSLRLDEGSLDPIAQPAEEPGVERGRHIVEALGARCADNGLRLLRQALRAALSRIERRISAVRGDIERTATADAMAEHARLFVAEAARTPRGATEITATDWSSGEPCTVRMALDPSRGAEEQLGAVFKRARRLKDGARIARARLEASESARSTLLATAERLDARDPEAVPDVDALAREAHAAAPHDFRWQQPNPSATTRRPAKQTALPPYRTFAGATGRRILVGRSGAHNDELSFHVARPHDLWLHVKSRSGAHVVVPLDRGMNCPSEVLIEAAHLAAHFSDAREEDRVEVEYTLRRYIRKGRGSPAGLVIVSREKVLVLRRSEIVLRKLLDGELER
jgi:hypothetical protein